MMEITETNVGSPTSMLTADSAPLTPLAHWLSGAGTAAADSMIEARGARTLSVFSDATQELSALVTGVAAFDAGARVRLRVSGEDRVRWLNGMVTNTVKTLATGAHNYTFVLNAQGRIQGDGTVFAFADHLLLETDRAQAEQLYTHLDRFIIMDDVELAWIDGQTAIGLAGPEAATLLSAIGLPVPGPGCFALADDGGPICIVHEESVHVPRFSLWVAEEAAAALWQRLLAAGARAAGAVAVEALRVLEGTPLYGVDINEKTLAQETGQMRALNFNKGCYLGQEIVERVRSRATVHRGIRQFALLGEPAVPGMQLVADGGSGEVAAGTLTSVVPAEMQAALPSSSGQVALGLVRIEALQGTLGYPGGSATLLPCSPLKGRE